MNELQRLRLIENIMKIENQLALIRFPAYGNLFLRHSVAENSPILLDPCIDSSGSYYIRSACGVPWFGGADRDDAHPNDIDPCEYLVSPTGSNVSEHRHLIEGTDLLSYGRALAQRSIWRMSHTEPQAHAMPKEFQGSQEDHESFLQLTMDLIPVVASYSLLQRSSTPVLWHTNWNMGIILVSEQDYSAIVSLIDWQSSSISPMFLQARWPVFLELPENYCRGLNLQNFLKISSVSTLGIKRLLPGKRSRHQERRHTR